jgi:glutathione S-transferase
MKLYYSPGACSMAPHIALLEAGLTHEIVPVNLKTHHFVGGDFYKVNPKGSVPTLELDNGEILTECAVILQYIADKAPEANLIPKVGTMQRYRAQEWLNWVATEMHKGFSPLWYDYTPEEYKTKIREGLAKKFDFLTGNLKTNAFLMGQYTVADSYLFTILGWAKPLKIELTKWPAILGYLEKIQARPAIQATMKAEGQSK